MSHVRPVRAWTVEQEPAADAATADSDDGDDAAGKYGPPAAAIGDRAKVSAETRRQLEVWG